MITPENLKEYANVSFYDICNEAYDILTQRKWNVTREAIATEMNLWLTSKSNKIERMIKSPYYNGNLQLVVPGQIIRESVNSEAESYMYRIYTMFRGEETKKNNDGKTADDVLKELLSDMPSELDINNLSYNLSSKIETLFQQFNRNFDAQDRIKLHSQICSSLLTIRENLSDRISAFVAEQVNSQMGFDKKKVIEGQKTSKVVSRLLHMWGNYEPYNKLFTILSDLLNGNVTQGYYVVSLNFLDYLRMSDGHSWSSCHTTDPHNTRKLDREYHGQYVQGCLAYANDDPTYITYFIGKDEDTSHPDRADKIYRQCMHVRDDEMMFINGRIYPQGNDGKTDIYKVLHKMFVDTMGYGNEFKNIGLAKENAFIVSEGANYPDYYYNRECKLYSKEPNDNYEIHIGEKALSCCHLGRRLDANEQGTII